MIPSYHWLTKETDHFVFYYLDHLEIEDSFFEERERAYEVISKYLDVELGNKINFYVFPNREVGLEMLGGLSPHQAIPGIYTILSRKEQTAGHELTHLLSYYMKEGVRACSPRVLSEGLATYLNQTGRDYRQIAKRIIEKGNKITLDKLLDYRGEFYKGENQLISYPVAASFTQFLIETYGLDKFKEVWGCDNDKAAEILEKAYGKDAKDLEREWLDWVRK